MFMLREGPLQRCPMCGQVYKLVRLRKEYTSEMNYYTSGLMPPEFQEFGEDDHMHHISYNKIMPDQYETSAYTMDSMTGYSLINPDDHDKVLVDPAFRMKKLTETQHKFEVFSRSIEAVTKDHEGFDNPFMGKTTIQKDIYDTLIDAEISMRKMDRAFKKSRRFYARQYLDLDNHERREQRMLERSRQRTEDSYTVYYGGMTEVELMHDDYFETDLEGEHTEAFMDAVDEEHVRSFPSFKTDNYNFIESSISRTHIADASSHVEKMIFNFRNRRCIDTVEDYERRQARVVARQLDRANSQEVSPSPIFLKI